MTTPTTARKLQVVEGLNYHERSRTLHLRLEGPDVFLQVVSLLQNGDLSDTEFLNLSLVDALFQPEQARIGTQEEHLMQMCGAMGDCLRNLKEIHIGRALSGFVHTNVGAWCPVEALQLLLDRVGKLDALMVRNLQVYSSNRREAGDQGTVNPVNLLAQALTHHPSLQRFGWQHSEFIPRAFPTLDPMLQSLSTISTLNHLVIQSPPWAVARVPTGQQVLETLIKPGLQALHLDGLHLQDNHIQSLLATPKQQNTLQTLSLSLKLTLSNIPTLASCLAAFLKNTSSSLLHLGLRLEWLVQDRRIVTKRFFRKLRVQALQDFQTTLTDAIDGDSRIQRLDLIYYESTHRWGEGSPSINDSLSPSPFHRVLETNYTLTHLRLPFCGEMHPSIDFLLKLNRTGLRHRLLRGNPSPIDCLDAIVEAQEPSNRCIPAANVHVGLSRVFHLLGEMPTLFL